MQAVDTGGGLACMRTGVFRNSVFAAQFCSEPKTALKNHNPPWSGFLIPFQNNLFLTLPLESLFFFLIRNSFSLNWPCSCPFLSQQTSSNFPSSLVVFLSFSIIYQTLLLLHFHLSIFFARLQVLSPFYSL